MTYAGMWAYLDGMTVTARNFRLDDDDYAACRLLAEIEGTTVTAYVADALRVKAANLTPEMRRAWDGLRAAAARPAVPEPEPAAAPVRAPRSRKAKAEPGAAECPHPKARRSKGLCGACGTFVGE